MAGTNAFTQNELLLKCARKGLLQDIENVWNENNYINLDAADKNGISILMKAAEAGHTDICKELIGNGAKVNSRDDKGQTPLMHGSLSGNANIVKHLLEKGSNINHSDYEGQTALMLVSYQGYEDIANVLIEKAADISMKDNEGRTALTLAAIAGESGCAELLMKNGARINDKDSGGTTALIYACAYGFMDIAIALIDNGADINEQDKRGHSALILARDEAEVDIVKLLIEKGAYFDSHIDKSPDIIEWAKRGNEKSRRYEEIQKILEALVEKRLQKRKDNIKTINEEMEKRNALKRTLKMAEPIMKQAKEYKRQKRQTEADFNEYKEKQLELIQRIQEEIEAKEKESQDHIDYLDSKLDDIREESPYFLMTEEQFANLKKEIKDLDAIIGLKEEEDAVKLSKSCPICTDEFKDEIYCCDQCNNFLCENCLVNVFNANNSCPNCRCDLRSRPMQRNRALEQILRQ